MMLPVGHEIFGAQKREYSGMPNSASSAKVWEVGWFRECTQVSWVGHTNRDASVRGKKG